MSRDVTWVEACSLVLDTSLDHWLSAPEIFKELKAKQIKDLSTVSYGQGVRSIRSNLNCHSKKAKGLFYRSDSGGIKYALKTRLDARESSRSPSPVCNGCAEQRGWPLTVEIDPCLKPDKPFKQLDASSAGLFLPSPLRSLLGPSRTLSVLSEYPAIRPVRKVRKKSRDKEDDQADTVSPPPVDGRLPSILQLEPRHTVPSLSSDVFCLKGMDSWDSCTVQGWQPKVQSFEIDPFYISESESSSLSDSDSCSIPLQPTPSQQLLVRRVPRPFSAVSSSDDEETPPPPEAPPTKSKPMSEPRVRLGANLFSPTSLLVNENIKLLLSRKSFDGLSSSQKRKLVQFLPSVDQSEGLSPSADALSNIFYNSATREWQDRMAIGAFTPEYRARERAEVKRRTVAELSNLAWKQQHYEEYWGEREELAEEGESYFPVASVLSSHQQNCLTVITTAYSREQAAKPVKLEVQPAPVKVSKKPPVSTIVRNHFLKAKAAKRTVIRVPNRKPVTKKRLSTIKTAQRFDMNHRLTSLPPKTPYRTLLLSLVQASRSSVSPTHRPWSLKKAPPAHSHSVFHDHFSLLSAEHVPLEFSVPITSLEVSLPLDVYVKCMQWRAAVSDHCYTPSITPVSLTLSLPRSLLHRTCVCARQPLAFCAQCHSMFHRACTNNSLCSNCSHTRLA